MKIDLSYPIRGGMFKYPSDPEIEIERKDAAQVRAYAVIGG